MAGEAPDQITELMSMNKELGSRVSALKQRLNSEQSARLSAEKELETLKAGVETRLAELGGELIRLREDLRSVQAQRDNAVRQLDDFRSAAVAALEPLVADYTRRMHDMIDQVESVRAQIFSIREDTAHRLDIFEHACAQLRESLNNTCSDLSARLLDVVGCGDVSAIAGERAVNAAETAEDQPFNAESIMPMTELMVAGLTRSAVIVKRHSRAS